MRYLVGCVCVLALLASPLSASAQAAPEDSLSSWQVEAKPAPEEPALQLKLDDTGVGVVPSLWRTPDGYTLEEMELRVKRARIGYGVSAGVLGVGVLTMLVAGIAGLATWEPLSGPPTSGGRYTRNDRALIAGAVVASSGLAGAITAGGILGHRKRKLRRLEQAHYGRPRRVQWDFAQSRLVF